MSAHALLIYRQPIPILPMEITTNNGALSLSVRSGSGWNSVKQGMFFMVMALQVSRCGRVNMDTLHGTKKYVLICVMSISVWDKLNDVGTCSSAWLAKLIWIERVDKRKGMGRDRKCNHQFWCVSKTI